MYRHSLRQRVAIAFALCVAVLSLAWGFAFFAAIKLTEDQVLQRQLQLAVNSYPVMPVNLRAYDQVANLPDSLQPWAKTRPAEGIYEFETEELHVAVIETGDALQPAFVVFDVAGIEAASSDDLWWILIISGVVGALGVLGFSLGVVVMRRAVAPVVELAKAVADIDLENFSAGDQQRIAATRFGNDEVGLLAEAIEKTLARISAFVVRERDFTSSASHELRTPITVITGALELLEQSELSAADKKVLERMQRASHDMKTMIELFLCLARETDNGGYDEQFFVMPLVSQAIELQRHLLSHKLIDVVVEQRANPAVCGHPQAFAIAVNNLVRNAFEHTLTGQGPITILIKEHELVITNQLGSETQSQHSPSTGTTHGYGLGLGIVQRLCERNGWSFVLLAEASQVIARLSWSIHKHNETGARLKT